MVIRINRLPAGFVIPTQPVLASKPPSGFDWVHEIKRDGYRMIVPRDGAAVRLYSRNANDWTARLAAPGADIGVVAHFEISASVFSNRSRWAMCIF